MFDAGSWQEYFWRDVVGYKAGAGFVVCRKFKDGIRYLGLKGPKHLRESRLGIWDIPKGQKDPGESDWECAQRETIEEAGIFIIESDCIAGPFSISSLVVYLVKTEFDPIITPNPVTGIMEHDGWAWLSGEELEKNCYQWLKPFVGWARDNFKSNDRLL